MNGAQGYSNQRKKESFPASPKKINSLGKTKFHASKNKGEGLNGVCFVMEMMDTDLNEMMQSDRVLDES